MQTRQVITNLIVQGEEHMIGVFTRLMQSLEPVKHFLIDEVGEEEDGGVVPSIFHLG